MPVLGIDEESWASDVSDSEEELDNDFNELLKQLTNEKTKKSKRIN
jgi:hypothetical protein